MSYRRLADLGIDADDPDKPEPGDPAAREIGAVLDLGLPRASASGWSFNETGERRVVRLR